MFLGGGFVMKVIESVSDWKLVQQCSGRGNGNKGCSRSLLMGADDLYFNVIEHKNKGVIFAEERYISFCGPVCGVETDIDKLPYYVIHYMETNYSPKKKKRLL